MRSRSMNVVPFIRLDIIPPRMNRSSRTTLTSCRGAASELLCR